MYTDPDPQFLAPARSMEIGRVSSLFRCVDLATLSLTRKISLTPFLGRYRSLSLSLRGLRRRRGGLVARKWAVYIVSVRYTYTHRPTQAVACTRGRQSTFRRK